MTLLARYETARRALAEASRIDQVVPLLDELEHVKLYARQIRDRSLLADATELQLRAERRLGEVIAAAKDAGHFREGRPLKENCTELEQFSHATLPEVGVDRKLSAKAQRAASLDDTAFESAVTSMRDRVIAGAATIIDKQTTLAEKQVRRSEREVELAAKQKALPDKRYGLIYADPEWRFETFSRETGLDRSADNHYPTSILDEIKARDVPSIAAKDCVLFLWTTAPMLESGIEVLNFWTFDYRSNFVWAKDRIGTGYWNRNKHEHLLIGTKGHVPAPAPGTQWDSLIEAALGEHSAKPEIFHELIEAYFPNLPKIELNRRGPPRPGWDAWGYEAEPTP